MRMWHGIIVDHSFTKDQIVADWSAIKRFHTSWRHGGDIITEEQAIALKARGEIVTPPWSDIGYHWGFEYVDRQIVKQQGRSMELDGAACIGKNQTHIQICVIGNFDESEPTEDMYIELAKLCREFMDTYQFDMDMIRGHFAFADKTCPGKQFNWTKFSRILMEV